MWRPLRILAGFCYQPKCPLKKPCFSLSFRAYWQCIKPSKTPHGRSPQPKSAHFILAVFPMPKNCLLVDLKLTEVCCSSLKWQSKGQSNSSNSHENRRTIKSTRNQRNHNKRTAKRFVSAQTRGTISVQCETRCELNPFRIARGGLGSRSTSLPGWFSHDLYIGLLKLSSMIICPF